MNKSILSLVIASSILSIAIGFAAAQKAPTDPEEIRRAQIAKAQKVLAGTTWTVYTTLQDKKKPEEGTETFTFTDRRVTTQNLAAQGYAAGGSNYSVYIETDAAIVWESMLKDETGENEVLLRGDLKGSVMTGVIDIQPEKGKGQRKVYYFTSQKEKPVTATKTVTTTGDVISDTSTTNTVKTTTTATTKTKK